MRRVIHKLIRYVLIGLVFINCGCEKNKNCGECFTPPLPFMFEIVDKQTDENLFTNGTFESAHITIINENDNNTVDYTFIDENDLNAIQIHSIGWQSEEVDISVKISDQEIFGFYVDAERINEECCSFTRYNEIRIDDSDYEVDSIRGIYRILFEH